MNVQEVVKRLPHPVRQGIKYAYGVLPPRIRYGRVFWETYNFLQESQWWSIEKLEEYQMQQLSKLLHHAYENVPYYRRIFDERGLKPKDIQDFDGLRKLPYLTKDIIQNNLEGLVARNYSKSRLQYATTGGSIGIPMGFYCERDVASQKEWAFMITQWNRVGYAIGDKRIVLRGNVVYSANKGNFWKYDPVNKQLILSSYHMTDENLPKYIKKMREYVPKFIHAYPSVITILARFMKRNNIKPFESVKAILCGSENIFEPQRRLLEDIFKCRVYSWYGHSEQASLAGECEKSSYYHIFPEYGIVELIDTNGKPVAKEEGIGEIVATGLNNFAFPFIRYRTADLGVHASQKCTCGRNYPLLKKVEGRLQDLIITKDNRLISLTSLIFAQHFEAFSRIKQMQFIQEKIGIVTLKIVKMYNYSENDEREILYRIKKTSTDKLDVKFAYVNCIPRIKRGKYKFLIQKLAIKL